MAASQYHFNTINLEYSRFSRAIIGYPLKLLAFKFYSSKIFIISSKSKENSLNIEAYGVFFVNFYSACFLRTKEKV